MTPPETFEKLAELATRELGRLGEEIMRVRRARLAAEKQLGALRAYQLDYTDNLHRSMSAGLDAAQCRTYQRFIDTLGEVMERQRDALAKMDLEITALQTREQKVYRRRQSLEALLARYQKLVHRREQRIAQKHSDEDAARMVLRQKVL
ncbi:MAG: flagellar export protein FliJ [Candidimonas sp.]|nr:MAG: flagellar export protein FliJ [Candidimonas sp.]